MKKIYLIMTGLIITGIIIMCGIMTPNQAEGNSNTKQQIQTTEKTTQILYAADGRQLIVSKKDVETYLKLQWYKYPVMYVYAPDGRTEIISKDAYTAWKKVGWYNYPITTVYAPDGREAVISTLEVENWISVGWFKTKQEALPKKSYSRNPFEKTNLNPEELEKCLSKGLSGYGYAFYQMEQTYGVNAIFAISVAELESGSGTSSAFRNKNNAFGIGPGKYFNSVTEGINYFGQLMNKPLYKGKSIDRIGSIYCVGGNWANKVKSLMEQNYQQL